MSARFPVSRPRRLRRTQALRDLVAETRLNVNDLVAPLFVREGIDSPIPILSLHGGLTFASQTQSLYCA